MSDEASEGTKKTIREIRRRTLADILGLFKSCDVRLCRRHRECMITEAVCLDRNNSLARSRLEDLLAINIDNSQYDWDFDEDDGEDQDQDDDDDDDDDNDDDD